MFTKLISSKLLLTILTLAKYTNTESIDIIYWEIKPFIFRNSDGNISGIFPKMFSEGQYYCSKKKLLINYKKIIPSRKKFYELLLSNITHSNSEFSVVNDKNLVWLPENMFGNSQEYKKVWQMRTLPLIWSNGIAIIMPRYMISLPIKMLRGIYSCRQIIALTLMLSLLFGIIIWFAEYKSNKQFSKYFIAGTGTGVWWSLVSMTTVGYGDVVLRSIVGKVIASIWLFIGVIIACLTTATITKTIKGLEGLDIYAQKVSVLENSYELKVANENYAAQIFPVKSYNEALDMVRDGKVFAALINVDVAAWFQKEITNDSKSVPLRIVNIIPAKIETSILIPMNLSVNASYFIECMLKQKDEVLNRSNEHFRRFCQTETLYIDSITDMFKKSALYQLLLGIVIAILFLGLGMEIVMRKSKVDKNEIQSFNFLVDFPFAKVGLSKSVNKTYESMGGKFI
ncbi:uncharacterized protein LOC124809004 [Hydra vulgaris]|uniref:Uncharacterized protein LOC124809004 n=1 Tax=Hydra vulgaris TaxID=6087 RepID=A0ABM4BHU2_HYDVU